MTAASPTDTERGLRAFLFASSALACVGAVAELAVIEHFGNPVQLVPFALAAAAIAALAAAWARPSPRSLRALRGVMVVVALGGVFGAWEHVEHNYAFAAEIRPNDPPSELVRDALLGANPLLAPGLFVLIALLGAAGTWRHPVLSRG